jgi:hypothetical protein
MRSPQSSAFLVVFGLAVWLGPAGAQVTSSIQGRIADPSGGNAANAQVKVTNEATGIARRTTSNAEGYYHVEDLLAGVYQIRVELAGFKTLVKGGIVVNAQTAVSANLMLELGEVTQTVNVTAQGPQVEITASRITEVIDSKEIAELPSLGRGILFLTMMSPGITGKAESQVGNLYCCDVFSNFGTPVLSSGANENKGSFLLDGINLRYSDNGNWAATFSPNPDAVAEMRVSTNPTSAEDGTVGGVQVQMVSKGGTNEFHGTAHYTFQENALDAVPYGSTRAAIAGGYKRQYGGTLGGPILKNRLFFFGAYEGLREKEPAGGFLSANTFQVVETEAFRDWVIKTRPNSIAAQVLSTYQPFRYPTPQSLLPGTSVDGTGVPDLGVVVMDRPTDRRGNQSNGRVDYQSSSGRDRLYGSYWYTRPDWTLPDLRPAFDNVLYAATNFVSIVYTHTFSPTALNEVRFGYNHIFNYHTKTGNAYNVPYLQTDDGLSLGNGAYSMEYFKPSVTEIGDTFSLNRGSRNFKFGGTSRRSQIDERSLLQGDTPEYYFASILGFANDNPYQELRALNGQTGKSLDPKNLFLVRELSFFTQNTWQIRPNLTLNFGLRWDDYFHNWLGRGRDNWEPVLTSSQVTPQAIATVVNQKVSQYYKPDLANFGPRISVAWDPTRKGRMAVRGGFFVVYDENPYGTLYGTANNPPAVALVSAGPQYGIPIVYGLAPKGTREFPTNPNLFAPTLNAAGAFEGTRPAIGGFVTNFRTPRTYDANTGVQYQLFNDVAVGFSYHFRETPNEAYAFDANRIDGDLTDSLLNRLNPNFGSITMLTNSGRRTYHGLILSVEKRLSHGWQLSASYTHNDGHDNLGSGISADNGATATEAYKPNVDWGRDDIVHVFHVHSVWLLPLFRGSASRVASALGGWELSTIWNLQSGSIFTPVSDAPYGSGGDFNADGQRYDRPDRPASTVPRSFSNQQWENGALNASVFPLPTTVRSGTLPIDYFRGPGYARVDLGLGKNFPLHWGREGKQLQFRADAFNALNRANISTVQNLITTANFGQATNFYSMRAVQFALKLQF